MGCMTIQDLCDMGPLVQAVAAPDALLFLWATCPRLPDAMRLCEAWGCVYKTVAFAWEKTYPKSGKTFRGPGAYTPSNLELLLLARPKKAKLWHPNTGKKPAQCVRGPHPRGVTGKIIHSRKPEVFQSAIEGWLGPFIGTCGYLEIFATRTRPGWTCLGHKVTGRDIRDDLAEIGDKAHGLRHDVA